MAGGKQNRINRRNFLKTIGVTGLGSVLAPAGGFAAQKKPDTGEAKAGEEAEKPALPQVPRRKLGKTGIEVASLGLGGSFLENQILLEKSLQWGVNYWDTAESYSGGNSELGIGKFFEKHPEKRKEVFLVTKSDRPELDRMQKALERSLKRMNTDYIDLYFIHWLDDPAGLTDEVKAWAEKTKKAKKFNLFGFSTHKNMPKCLAAAAKLGWIDAIMTKYDFRLMQNQTMQAAVQACHKAGIGLVAMKTQGGGPIKPDSEQDQKLAGHFLKQGYTKHQAKLKAVWQDNRFASICSAMTNLSILFSNVAAALDKTKLTQADVEVLNEYARATCSGYCAGCADICRAAVPDAPYVSDVMRYLMYYNSYGDKLRARELFGKIPMDARVKLASADYGAIEARCPQGLPIGELMAEAMSKLA